MLLRGRDVVSTQFMNSVDFDALRNETDLVLIPLGAVEIYGPHLPLGADGIATTALAERVAAEEPAFIAPLIPVGFSSNLMGFPGTLSVEPDALIAYTRGIVESYIRWGARRFLFLNGHAGNVPYISKLGSDLEDNHGVKCAQIDWWRFIQPLSKDLEASDAFPHGHAAEFGTSVMLHLVPEHVKSERAIRDMPESEKAFPDFLRASLGRERSPSGVIGDATLGTAEKGAEVMNRAVERVLSFIRSEHFTIS